MNRVVYKYPLTRDYDVVITPTNPIIVCVHIQNNIPTLWIEHDELNHMAPDATRDYKIINTGEEVPKGFKHIGTCFRNDGIVLHIYEGIQ